MSFWFALFSTLFGIALLLYSFRKLSEAEGELDWIMIVVFSSAGIAILVKSCF